MDLDHGVDQPHPDADPFSADPLSADPLSADPFGDDQECACPPQSNLEEPYGSSSQPYGTTEQGGQGFSLEEGRALYDALHVPLGTGVWTETPNLDLFDIQGGSDGDGILDTAAFQVQIGDRLHDAWASDLDHDGVADVAFVDSDGDGQPNVALLFDGHGGWQQVSGTWLEPAAAPRPVVVRPPEETGHVMVDVAARYETTFTEMAIAYWEQYVGAQVPYPTGDDGYAVGGYTGFLTMLQDHGNLLTKEQVDEIGAVVGRYQGTISSWML